ncbi:MAG: LppP/LprE family lipoprotein [Synechococcales cyanobacterium M58_A2018_015]|nr:LppP/LprE family lipoprotein [Synechococcales cyanobacterium M58_A2018_015]
MTFATALGSRSLLLVFMLLPPLALTQTESSDSWLDGNTNTTNWNQAGAAIPQAPAFEGSNLPACEHTVRQATLPEDELVQAAGWVLFGAAQIFNSTTVITGMANADGMCRPLSYQVFVFTNGEFSGTLSPIPMNSRTDGSMANVNLYREGSLSASFNRYMPEDALCCPSGKSLLFYEVQIEADAPVLVPQWPATTSSPD